MEQHTVKWDQDELEFLTHMADEMSDRIAYGDGYTPEDERTLDKFYKMIRLTRETLEGTK